MFLPTILEEVNGDIDFVYVTGDAYVDHPSFGVAIISRVLEAFGYKVFILSQPRWQVLDDFKKIPIPKLGFLVSSGNIDSIVNHYSVSKHKRAKDSYSEGGIIGKRPDYAVSVYCNILKKLYPSIPVIIGGIEASLRRLAHYDYYSNKLKKSILIDSNADIISYGMGEVSIVEIADCLKANLKIEDIIFIKGTVFKTKDKSKIPTEHILLPSYKEISCDKLTYAKSFKIQYENTDCYNSKALVEEYDGVYVVCNTPALPLEKDYLDWVYSLDYQRTYHPKYTLGVPAILEVKNSITINRGCLGSCSFCALNFHQGRHIQSRSKDSVVSEALKIIEDKNFKGYIHDIGGPTANFIHKACKKSENGMCRHKQCLYPTKCSNLYVSHKDYLEILKTVRNLNGVKKVFVRSGIRYDYVMYDKNSEFLEELIKNHISGQLKIAPEHVSSKVLKYMQKPSIEVYESFVNKYYELNQKYQKKQFLVSYLMSSHPGCSLVEAIELACYLHKNRIRVEQVQDFYPTPGTLSTAMFYTGVDPRTNEAVYVATSPHEKAMQRALMHYNMPQNYELVYEALTKMKRFDLIGYTPNCLIKPKKNVFNKIKNKK